MLLKNMRAWEKSFDTVAVLYATSPLIDPEDLRRACVEFEAIAKQALVSGSALSLAHRTYLSNG